jgi:RNA polymerase sigma-70 factor (ECF subfamily)
LVKQTTEEPHSSGEVSLTASAPSLVTADAAGDVESIYRAHGDFMWASLHRLGVRDADLPDALQDVLVVVHRRLHTYDGECKITSWLGIVCAGCRAFATIARRARASGDVRLPRSERPSRARRHRAPERRAPQARGGADTIDPEKRAVP